MVDSPFVQLPLPFPEIPQESSSLARFEIHRIGSKAMLERVPEPFKTTPYDIEAVRKFLQERYGILAAVEHLMGIFCEEMARVKLKVDYDPVKFEFCLHKNGEARTFKWRKQADRVIVHPALNSPDYLNLSLYLRDGRLMTPEKTDALVALVQFVVDR